MAVLAQQQIQLIGGHSLAGNDLAFGLSCNGFAQPEQLWPKGGLQPGQALILTKALGTGTLFAAAAQGKAKGRWIDGAIAAMVQSNAPAVAILRQHQTTACTDITGFGLLGHLGEMVKASATSIALELAALPLLPGAAETLGQGIVSSMDPANGQAQRWVSNWPEKTNELEINEPATNEPQAPVPRRILFDPQTSGGLLAALPREQAEACVAALQAQGYGYSRIIGHSLAEGSPQIQLI